MAIALTGARIFDGDAFHEGKAVLIEGGRITGIVEVAQLAGDVRPIALGGGLLAPGFIDVQVNGGGGALLNSAPTVECVQQIAKSHRKFGTVGMLPTVITDRPEVTTAAIAAVREARASVPELLGIHVEGPFLDPARKGAHEAHLIRPREEADITLLTEAKCGVLMVTVAPNRVEARMIRRLAQAGVRVSLGHAEARFAEARAALDAGATAFTHLYNAMSQLTGREPGMVGAALSDEKSFIGIIADGHHVHDVSLWLAFATTPLSRFILVSDAMPPAAGGPDQFLLQGRMVTRVKGRLQLDDGTLAGSNLTMDEAVRHCVGKLGVPLAAALQMASRNPARFLGLDDLGVIAPGARASLVHLDDDLAVKQTWVDGQ
ncbi:MAG: N-acetylglucosamine-6-phosphate deacetylase [Hyphomicrobiales bacterium]